jgi:hypothetical protein
MVAKEGERVPRRARPDTIAINLSKPEFLRKAKRRFDWRTRIAFRFQPFAHYDPPPPQAEILHPRSNRFLQSVRDSTYHLADGRVAERRGCSVRHRARLHAAHETPEPAVVGPKKDGAPERCSRQLRGAGGSPCRRPAASIAFLYSSSSPIRLLTIQGRRTGVLHRTSTDVGGNRRIGRDPIRIR